MGKRNLRTCCVCHKEYSFCTCNAEDRGKPLFYYAYCSENCRDIYKVTSAFENSEIDVEEANTQLSKLDLREKENFGESYKKTLRKISDELKSKEPEPILDVVHEGINSTEEVESEASKKVFKYSSKKRGYKSVE